MSRTDGAVTLVVACYNHEAFVAQALESVAAQTVQPSLIITDDHSSDDTVAAIHREVARLGLSPRLVLHDQNRGLCATFNEALALVETPLVAFISADDWMEPDRIEKQGEALMAAPDDVALLYSDALVHEEDDPVGKPYSQWPPAARLGLTGDLYDHIIAEGALFVPTPSVMMRTACVRAVGGYDERLPFEDHDMYLRLARDYRFECLPEPLVHYRRHSSNMTSDESRARLRKWDEAGLVIFTKHLGHSSANDKILTGRMFDIACRLYKEGAAGRRLAPHFRRYAQNYRSITGVAYWLFGILGIPGRLVARLRPVRET